MNLNFAAQFLDESIYLTEDADSKGREKTIKWLKNNFALDQYGMSATDNAVDDNDNPIRFVPQHDTEERLPGPNTEYIFYIYNGEDCQGRTTFTTFPNYVELFAGAKSSEVKDAIDNLPEGYALMLSPTEESNAFIFKNAEEALKISE